MLINGQRMCDGYRNTVTSVPYLGTATIKHLQLSYQLHNTNGMRASLRLRRFWATPSSRNAIRYAAFRHTGG